MSYDNTNKIALFKNDKKGNDKAPEYRGRLNVDGVDKEVSMWLRKSEKGVTYMAGEVSAPFKPQQTQQQQTPNQVATNAQAPENWQDVPF